jgi:hypothetical protein
MNTEQFRVFSISLNEVRSKISDDTYFNRLLMASLITQLEVYLLSVTVGLIVASRPLMIRLAESGVFKKQTISISKAIENDMGKFMVAQVKNIVFHNLSDIEPLFRQAFDIRITVTKEIIGLINLRHDIVHRNGYTKDGVCHDLQGPALVEALEMLLSLVNLIDKQLIEKFPELIKIGQ